MSNYSEWGRTVHRPNLKTWWRTGLLHFHFDESNDQSGHRWRIHGDLTSPETDSRDPERLERRTTGYHLDLGPGRTATALERLDRLTLFCYLDTAVPSPD